MVKFSYMFAIFSGYIFDIKLGFSRKSDYSLVAEWWLDQLVNSLNITHGQNFLEWCTLLMLGPRQGNHQNWGWYPLYCPMSEMTTYPHDCRRFMTRYDELHISLNIFFLKSDHYIDGLVQERRNPIANSLELRLSCTKPSIWTWQSTTIIENILLYVLFRYKRYCKRLTGYNKYAT